PHAVAVVSDQESLSYLELNFRANQLAHYLRTSGVQPGERVATLLERSVELVIAELAVLKCGAAYVPIDPAFPRKRIEFILSDSEIKAVCSCASVDFAGMPAIRRIFIDHLSPEAITEDVAAGAVSQSIAYVMYTSGSTGEPKGVMVPHCAIS